MTQLNKAAKEDMCRSMILSRFEADMNHIDQEFKKLADRVWEEEYGGHEQAMKLLPAKWFVNLTDIHAKFVGYHPVYKDVSGSISGLGRNTYYRNRDNMEMTEPRIQVSGFNVDISFDASHKLTKRFLKLVNEEDELFEAIRLTEGQIITQLNSLRTAKRIKDHWPEAVKFFPDGESAWLPALPVTELNATLGLDVPTIVTGN